MWTMPRNLLRIVAGLIALLAVTGFVLGIRGVPDPARLPGEGLSVTGAAPLEADDATPIGQESLAPPPPPPPAPKPEVKKIDPLDAAAPPAPLPIKPMPSTAPAVPDDKVGDLIDGLTPPAPEEPPH